MVEHAEPIQETQPRTELKLVKIERHQDDPIPLEASRVTASLTGATLHPVPRCGHVPYVEAREEFTRVVGGFLRS